jgi:hypothetical protein
MATISAKRRPIRDRVDRSNKVNRRISKFLLRQRKQRRMNTWLRPIEVSRVLRK